jgi:hypothetical protein
MKVRETGNRSRNSGGGEHSGNRANFDDVNNRYDRMYNKRIDYNHQPELDPANSNLHNQASYLDSIVRRKNSQAQMPPIEEIEKSNNAINQMRKAGKLPLSPHRIINKGAMNLKNNTSSQNQFVYSKNLQSNFLTAGSEIGAIRSINAIPT